MSVYQYPKTEHVRKLSPRVFKNYKSYKRFLQFEFVRVCVYCRQPDCQAPNLIFGVDHYRPKGVRRFAHLACEYNNLFYCCPSCNSRKKDYWPSNEVKGLYVVNPCDYPMASHIRFDAKSGRMEGRSPHGEHTIDLLQLNDDETVTYRRVAVRTIEALDREISEITRQRKSIEKLFRASRISAADYELELKEIDNDLGVLQSALDMHSGTLPLKSPAKKRLGVSLC